MPTLIAVIEGAIELQGDNFVLLAALGTLMLAAAVAVFPTLLTISHVILTSVFYLLLFKIVVFLCLLSQNL